MGTQEELDAIPPQHDATLITERLLLRPVRGSDLRAMHEMRRQAAVMKFMPSGVETSDDPYACYSFERIRIMKAPGGFSFAVCLREDSDGDSDDDNSKSNERGEPLLGQTIGFLGLFRPPAEIGYIFNQNYWGRGYATEALAAFVGGFWRHFPPGQEHDALEAWVHAGNDASERVLQKLGFVEDRKETVDTTAYGDVVETIFRIRRPEMEGKQAEAK